MTSLRWFAVLLSCALAGAAQAGSTAVGPGIGSIVTPGSHVLLGTQPRDENADRIAPGNGATLVLQGEQLTRTAEALRGIHSPAVRHRRPGRGECRDEIRQTRDLRRTRQSARARRWHRLSQESRA
jgi:hypothetical protein